MLGILRQVLARNVLVAAAPARLPRNPPPCGCVHARHPQASGAPGGANTRMHQRKPLKQPRRGMVDGETLIRSRVTGCR